MKGLQVHRAQVLRLLFLVAGLLLLVGGAMAQTEAESSAEGILLQSQNGKPDVLIPVGSRMSVDFRQDRRTRKVVLEAVTDSAMVLSGDTVDPKYLLRVEIGRGKLGQIGKVLTLVSTGTILAMVILVTLAVALYLNASALLVIGVLIILLALPFVLAFPIGLILGIVLWAIGSKQYHLGWAWKAKIVKKH